jgi:uncharacterized protein (DUF927 family)
MTGTLNDGSQDKANGAYFARLHGMQLRHAQKRLVCALLRQSGLAPTVLRSGIRQGDLPEEWRNAFHLATKEPIRGKQIVADPNGDPTIRHLYRQVVELGHGAALRLAEQIVASVRRRDAAADPEHQQCESDANSDETAANGRADDDADYGDYAVPAFAPEADTSHKSSDGSSKKTNDPKTDQPQVRKPRKPKLEGVGEYSLKRNGLFHGDKWLSANFEIVGRARDPDSNGWGRCLRWKDDDDHEHTQYVSDAELHGDASALCSKLAQLGLKISTSKRALFLAYLNHVESKIRVTSVGRTGWHDIHDSKAFVLPDRTIGRIADETVIFAGTHGSPYASRGSLDDWKNSIGKLVDGHDRPMFSVSIGFASPLLHLIGMEGGGVNLFGASSTGKTTTTQASASVWGRGDTHGFMKTWRATANGLEGAAVLHTDTLLPLDELGVADAREVGTIVYQLAGGIGKGRAARDGSLRASNSWRVMITSTAELRITDKIGESGKKARAGQEVRIIDIPADAGKGFGVFDHAGSNGNAKQLADAIKAAACTHYGTAGPAFVEAVLAEGFETVASDLREALARFRAAVVAPDATGQVQRVADRFALIAASGELAIRLNIVPWPAGSARKAAVRLFNVWLEQRGGVEPAEVRDGVEQVRALIARFGSSRFDPVDVTDRHPVPDRLGWCRGDGGDRLWFIPPEVWKSTFAAGFDATLVARALSDRGMLTRSPEGFARSEWIEGRTMRVYVLTANVAAVDEHQRGQFGMVPHSDCE